MQPESIQRLVMQFGNLLIPVLTFWTVELNFGDNRNQFTQERK